MLLPLMHSEGPNLPLSVDAGAAFLGAGVVVLAVITYDIYRQHYSKGEG